VFSKPNALTPPINYYRAWIRSSVTSHLPPLELIRIRTLLIWGERDRALICEGFYFFN
jgi:pimeloyl-ACP methyl ester carboxylesterase